jgi:hypothetical protein
VFGVVVSSTYFFIYLIIADCMADGGLAAIERDLENLIAGFQCESPG